MNLFGNKVVEVDIEFYGQKKRKIVSTTTTEVYVEIIPTIKDPALLSIFYFEFLMQSAENILFDAKPIFWEILNRQLKEVKKDHNMMYTWESLVDTEPIVIKEKKKKCCYIKGTLSDNGKLKFKLCDDSRGGLEVYYIPIGAMAFLQHIIDVLSDDDLKIFYTDLSELIKEKRASLEPSEEQHFGIMDLPPYCG